MLSINGEMIVKVWAIILYTCLNIVVCREAYFLRKQQERKQAKEEKKAE